MQLLINGFEATVTSSLLSDLLAELHLDAACVATAVNGSFVSVGKRNHVRLEPYDRVEIVSPRQGG